MDRSFDTGHRRSADWHCPGYQVSIPEPMEGADLRQFYYGPMRPIWWIGLGTVAIASTFRPLMVGTELLALDNANSFFVMLLFGICIASNNSRTHAIVVPIMLIGVLVDILYFTFVIG